MKLKDARKIALDNLRRWLHWEPDTRDKEWLKEIRDFGFTEVEAREILEEARGQGRLL